MAIVPLVAMEETVCAQLNDINMTNFGGAGARRQEFELHYGLNSTGPALESWAGLSNGPKMLNLLPGFGRLHVRRVASCAVQLLFGPCCASRKHCMGPLVLGID